MSDDDTTDPEPKKTMRVVEGKFGGKKEEEEQEITTAEFLMAFAAKASVMEEEKRSPKVVVVMYEDGEMFEVASNEQYPDGVHMLLQLASQAILNETLGVTE